MFETSEQLMEFVDNADEVLMDQIFEGAVSDLCLYEDEYIIQALDRYVEMLESDKVDEKFEEHLSTVLAPYFVTSASFYENVMVLDEGKIKVATTLAKAKLGEMKKGADAGLFKAKRAIQNAPAKLKAKVGANVAAAKRGVAAVGEKLGNAAFDTRFKARGFMKNMRHKYGAKALANKIKKGYQSAAKWAKDSSLGRAIQHAYATGMTKRAVRLGKKANEAMTNATKINQKLAGATA